METIEGNKILAEFMGAEFIPDWTSYFYKDPYPTFRYPLDATPTKTSSIHWSANALYYHIDWGWLMPVVEKIESLTTQDGRGEVNYIVSIEERQCIISVGGENPIVEVGYMGEYETKIDAVWQAVVAFIQKYK